MTSCPSAGRPVEFLKTDFSSPSARARSVISLAKFSSDPAMPSATMMQPSLADCTTMPWIRASSGMTDFSSANMVEPPDGAPPVRHAFSLTTNVSASECCPVLTALNMTSDVISLASEAGGISLSASLENSTVPVSASTMKACLALVSNNLGGSRGRQRDRQAQARGAQHRSQGRHDWSCPVGSRPATSIARECGNASSIRVSAERQAGSDQLDAGSGGYSRTVMASEAPFIQAASRMSSSERRPSLRTSTEYQTPSASLDFSTLTRPDLASTAAMRSASRWSENVPAAT